MLFAAAPQACQGNTKIESMFNPYTTLVFLIGQPSECKRNPYIGTAEGIKVFSLLAEGGLNPRNACS